MGGTGYGRTDTRLSRKGIETAFEKGIRHFDTAGFYSKGNSERLLRLELSAVRKEVFISTKGGLVWEGNRVLHRAAPSDLGQQLAQSLERLGTNYIDLFQLHWPDPRVPIGESLAALKEMQEKGLIRFWGAGNLNVGEIRDHFLPGSLIPLQTPFNPCRRAAHDILRAGSRGKRTINCIVSPFEQGLLANARFLDSLPGKKDVRRRNPLFFCQKLKEKLAAFFDIIERMDISASAFLLLWLLGIKEVDVVIPGPRTPDQVEKLLQHTAWLSCNDIREETLRDVMIERFGPRIFTLLDEIGADAAACLEWA